MRKAKTIIHVNRHNIAHNKKTGENKPIFTVKSRGTNRYGHSVIIHGPSQMVYAPCSPLSCGAMAWNETYAEVDVFDADGKLVSVPARKARQTIGAI